MAAALADVAGDRAGDHEAWAARMPEYLLRHPFFESSTEFADTSNHGCVDAANGTRREHDHAYFYELFDPIGCGKGDLHKVNESVSMMTT